MTTTYTVRPKRWDHGYELHIEGLGVTQVDDLSEAEETARDFIALDLEVPEDSFSVEIAPAVHEHVEIPASVDLRDLAAWERHIWVTPDMSVAERETMIAIMRVVRQDTDFEDSAERLWLALNDVRQKQHRSAG
ncbi:hypothetical protein [Actinomadura decatromicini]|uniref:Uncharacterized protein n=1 Tax=Actinomadura decatromicini TaxID=2604572 RepID=A0A5D3FB22_9ACTN|nr:hypothetical protein [Actinomadura decatromicini]TYK45104.1 hypothetical protein FXF68_30955 [Actinomadura decatromicini]